MPEKKNHIYLGFDFGMRRMGVAVGQVLTQTATPLITLKMQQGEPNWDEIKKIIADWHPQGLIVGIPYNSDTDDDTIIAAALNFRHQLEVATQLPVYEMDERLSTKEARERLFAKGGYRSLKKETIDSFAACLMLESWLRQLPLDK